MGPFTESSIELQMQVYSGIESVCHHVPLSPFSKCSLASLKAHWYFTKMRPTGLPQSEGEALLHTLGQHQPAARLFKCAAIKITVYGKYCMGRLFEDKSALTRKKAITMQRPD